jgi:AraC-like DNA-binding protein
MVFTTQNVFTDGKANLSMAKAQSNATYDIATYTLATTKGWTGLTLTPLESEGVKGVELMVRFHDDAQVKLQVVYVDGTELSTIMDKSGRYVKMTLDKSKDIREVTIQFDFDFSDASIFGRNPFNSMRKMMVEAQKGLCFPMDAIMKVYQQIDTLSSLKDGFYAFQQFLAILYELSRCEGARPLATSSYAKVDVASDSRRVLKVKNYINENYRHEIRLADMASLAGMSPSAFSRFFKLHTGRNLTDYIIDMRLGYASRQLVDSTDSIAEISYGCGFNNLSNFNRIFRKKKGCSPSEFRENYHKTRIII